MEKNYDPERKTYKRHWTISENVLGDVRLFRIYKTDNGQYYKPIGSL